MWRAGFGPAVEQLGDLSKYSPKQFYKALVKASEKTPEYIDVADDYLKGLLMGIGEAGAMQKKDLDKDDKKIIQQKNRDGIRNLNIYWMYNMVNSADQLREKMAFFWHGHFASRNLNIFYEQGLLDILRKNALGNFGTLLKEVSQSAAMLNFLNNQQNKKDHPNENFAREVMELFTLGRGNYTEHDVKEGARAFTGWGANLKGDFMFRKGQHDFDSKTFLGKTGTLDGNDVLDILLQQKQTARYITQKLYKFLVNEQPDAAKVEWLADRFYKNNYEISPLLEDIFTSDWFYDEKNIGAKIKSPVELLVGIQRMLPMKIENEDALILLQRVLGQLLFYPPNVAGWPGGKNWIDSSSLMMRMRIPKLINDIDEMNVKPKDDDDQMMGRMDADGKMISKPVAKGGVQNFRPRGQLINANVDWSPYIKNFESIEKENLLVSVSRILLQTNTNVSTDIIKQYADNSGRENFIKTATLQIMSTPEYQLC
jgi:uncharacterized protein (DUF1800 family)